MPLTWTSLHRALGLTPGHLTFDDIQLACAQQVAEEADLDWKRELPGKDGAEEFAKDVAAMANTDGGLIVFGVHENSARAVKISPQTVDDLVMRTLRQYLSRIQPTVFGVEFRQLAPRDGAPGVLLMAVPASPDAPHLFYPPTGSNDMFSAPYRYGTGTNWMTETQLARAYQDRFARRTDQRQTLDSDLASAREHITVGDHQIWLLGAAEPHRGRAHALNPVDREQREELAMLGRQLASNVSPASDIWGSDFRHTVVDPEQGLRRWIIRTPPSAGYPHYAELRYDASVVLAVAVHSTPNTSLELNQEAIEGFVADLVGFAGAAGHVLGTPGPWSLQMDMVMSPSRTVKLFSVNQHVAPGLVGRLFVDGTRPLSEFTPVTAHTTEVTDSSALRAAARSLVTDVINQFGATKIYTIVGDEPGPTTIQ